MPTTICPIQSDSNNETICEKDKCAWWTAGRDCAIRLIALQVWDIIDSLKEKDQKERDQRE